MKPNLITLHNFRSYADDTVSLSPIHVAVVTGDNGSGKSSLLYALTWALYGEGPWPNTDDCIKNHQDECRVEFTFSLSGQEYRVIRSRSTKGRGKSLLELAVREGDSWRNITGDNVTDTQAKIIRLLRMEYRTLTSAAFILQGQADAFTASTPAQRQAVLSQVLELDEYDRLEALAKEKARGYRDQIELDKRDMARLDAAIGLESAAQQLLSESQLRLEAIAKGILAGQQALEHEQAKKEQLVAEHATVKDSVARVSSVQTEIDRLERQMLALRAKKSTAEQVLSRREEILKALEELGQIEGRLFELDQDAQDVQALQVKVNELRREIDKAEAERASEIRVTEQTLRTLQNKAQLLAEVNCDRQDCRFLQDAFAAKRALPEVENKLQALRASKPAGIKADQLGELTMDLQRIRYDPRAHMDLKRKAADLRRYHALKASLDSADQTVTEAAAAIADLQTAVAGKREELATLQLAGVKESELRQAIRQSDTVLNEIRQRLSRLTADEKQVYGEIAGHERVIAAAQEARIQKRGLESRIAEAALEQDYYALLATAFGRNGVPLMIMESAIPEIERLANDLLSRMTGGAMSVALPTRRETKTTKDLALTLDVVIADSDGPRPYLTWSGAERLKVDLAIRVAISQFLAHRAGTKIECLVIDEGVGALDPRGRQAFLEAVKVISQEFARVLCITHIEEVKEAFDQRIEVRKTDQGSRVEVIA